MKLKSVISAVLLSAFFATMASGCNVSDFGTDSLLRPPKTMGDEAEIEQLISDTAKSGYTLKYPKNGNYRSAIVMTDLDGDNVDEAIAFYQQGTDTTHIHMLVMYSDNDVWKLSSNSITETTDVDSVDFADVDGNSSKEIIVGFSTYSTNINHLSAYTYKGGETTEIKSGQSYSNFYCGDFDGDGNAEVMCLLLYTTENEASATMLDYSDSENSLYSKATVAMDPNVTKYRNVSVASFDDKSKGLVIDGGFANDEMNTQIIYYNTELSLLRNPLYSEKSKSVTQRSCSVISTDVDHDGSIEIPVVSKLPHKSDEATETIGDKIEWNSFSADNETTTPKMYMMANYNYNYTFKIPDNWVVDTVTTRLDAQSGTMEFYEWSSDGLGSKLFTIKVFELADWNLGTNTDNYSLIKKDDKYAYAFNNQDTESTYSLSDDEIKTAFSALTEFVV